MSDDEMRIFIAEACGWQVHHGGKYVSWVIEENGAKRGSPLSDPLIDLNAMHEAEKVLTDEQYNRYSDHLCDQSVRDMPMAEVPAAGGGAIMMPIKPMRGFSQTARQRAEAFIKTLKNE